MSEVDLDPRYDWVEISRLGALGSEWVKGTCRHIEVIPVESVTGDVVAQLCLTCDRQFQV